MDFVVFSFFVGGGLGLPCPFFERNEKKANKKKPDNKIQTRKQASLAFKKKDNTSVIPTSCLKKEANNPTRNQEQKQKSKTETTF